MKLISLLIITISCSWALYANERQTLTLATTTWCPYTCDSNNNVGGIIGNFLQDISKEMNIDIVIESVPWSRAIRMAQFGDVDGLLTAIHSEAPFLNFTTQPIAYYQVCFFTDQHNSWLYSPPLNMGDNTLGLLNNYGYGESIDNYIAQEENKNHLVEISGDYGVRRLVSMLQNNRIDVFISDKTVFHWQAKQHNLDTTNIKNAGCLAKHPFYLALSPSLINNRALLAQYDEAFKAPKNIERLLNYWHSATRKLPSQQAQ